MQIIMPTAGQRSRVTRTPNFPIAGTVRPFQLAPFFFTPVLPGETLTSFNAKIRRVSKPVKHPLVGAWSEMWLCYVKFTDLDRDLGNMFISNDYSDTGYTAASDQAHYFTHAGQYQWLKLCVERIHDAYFVDEDETPRSLGNYRQIKAQNMSWANNIVFKPSAVSIGDNALEAGQTLTAEQMFTMMAMSEMSYEDYLKDYGIQTIQTALGDPEILRYAKSWTFPVNTVEPSTGVPSSAFVWNDEVKAEKNIRFTEPGFLVGLHSIRPKMYNGAHKWSRAADLWGFSDWYPIYNQENPVGGAREISTGDPVLSEISRVDAGELALLVDHRDLLVHGESFVNDWDNGPDLPVITPSAEDADVIQTIRGQYATSTDIDNIFTGSTAADRLVYYEGICQATIRGHVKDTIR